jgi:hypothetical protein
MEVSHTFNVIWTRINALGMNAKYLTIVAAPNAIEDRMYSWTYKDKDDNSLLDIYLSLDQYLYTTDNHLYVGRIMGISSSDVSGYLARDLFYDSLPDSNYVLFMASSFDDEIKNAINWANEFTRGGYSVESKTSPDSCYEFDPELWEKHDYQMISYQDHGGSSWLGIDYDKIPNLNKAFVVADACSTLSTYETYSFWANAIRHGGIGYVGAVSVGFTNQAPLYRDTINGVYYNSLSIGEAFGESYEDNIFDNFDILNMDIMDKWRFMTTLVGDPTLNINPSYKINNLLK